MHFNQYITTIHQYPDLINFKDYTAKFTPTENELGNPDNLRKMFMFTVFFKAISLHNLMLNVVH